MQAALISGTLLGLSAGISPGPLLMLVIAQTLTYNAKEGYKVAAVPLITDLPVVVLSLIAVSRISEFKTALGVVSFAGGLYVAYLAYESVTTATIQAEISPTGAHSILKGCATNLLSPHPWLFWCTVGSPLAVRYWGHSPFSGVLFIICFYVHLVGSKMLLAGMVSKSRGMLGRKGYRWAMRAIGCLLAVFAVYLIHTGWKLTGMPFF